MGQGVGLIRSLGIRSNQLAGWQSGKEGACGVYEDNGQGIVQEVEMRWTSLCECKY
jgi:hypothetical protein